VTTAENKEVIAMFVEDVINQGRLNRTTTLLLMTLWSLILFQVNSRDERFKGGHRPHTNCVSRYPLGP
jgi:hypothetical protein